MRVHIEECPRHNAHTTAAFDALAETPTVSLHIDDRTAQRKEYDLQSYQDEAACLETTTLAHGQADLQCPCTAIDLCLGGNLELDLIPP